MRTTEVRELVLDVLEASLELQLRAVRQLRGTEPMPPPVRLRRALRKQSLVDLSLQILQDERRPLHVSELVFGTLSMGRLQSQLPPEEGARVIVRGVELGIDCIDTAQSYATYEHVALALRQLGRADTAARNLCLRQHANQNPAGNRQPSADSQVSHIHVHWISSSNRCSLA